MIGRIEFRAFLEDQIMNYLCLLEQTNPMRQIIYLLLALSILSCNRVEETAYLEVRCRAITS